MLAHKFVEQSMGSDFNSRKQNEKKSWWSLGWSSQSVKDETEPGTLTEEDWERLNNIIGYKESDAEQLSAINTKKDDPQLSLEVHMKHNASKLTAAEECLADLSCDNLDCYITIYAEAKLFDVKLGSYRLLSPNGLLAESATSHDSVVATYCYKPFNSNVDWSMVAKASPCYVTYLKDSIDQIMNFFKSNTAVTQTIALETAAALQMTIDEVKRTAQLQVNRALKDFPRFLLDLDIAAPKITIPTSFCPDGSHCTKLLLDLGNLLIQTKDDSEYDSPEANMYFQFNLVLSDVSAFLVDGEYHWSNASGDSSKSGIMSCLPVIDRCGVFLNLQQIQSNSPLLPSTRVSVRLPSLGFHFSPARYHRLMQVAKIFQGGNSDTADQIRPWDQADFEGWLSLLTLKGIGGREAVWQRRYICIVGPFIYVLDYPGSRSYKQSLSLRGKQLIQVPSNIVGDIEHVIGVCGTERVSSKILEDSNALILRCETEDSRKTWQSSLQAAIYRASVSTPISGFSESSSDSEESETDNRGKKDSIIDLSSLEKIFLTGVLDELRICFNYSGQEGEGVSSVLLAEERRLFEFRATGSRVEFLMKGNDIFIGLVLKALEIEDLVCRKGKSKRLYVARSFIRSADAPPLLIDTENQGPLSSGSIQSDGEDNFYEAPEDLNDLDSAHPLHNLPKFSRVPGLLPLGNYSGSDHMDVTDTLDSFVKAQIVIYDQNSPLYTDIDTQVTLKLATLTFYCRRPMILAIMKFVNEINTEEEIPDSRSDSSSAVVVQHGMPEGTVGYGQPSETFEEPVVKGLLGKGKSRIVFYLALNMARAQILLMKENGSKLATLAQDNFLTEIKVFPSSFSIQASLGNLRISDDSLFDSHPYFFACDMRNPGGSSFIELMFCSFSAADDDYEGYDYCLIGQLSEVRIIFLNRFLQEMTSYFMGLSPSNSNDDVRVKDQVSNSERSFKKSEIEGSPAIKLDISLKKPIILMPKRTDSADYMKLDVVHITVKNSFRWVYGSRNEMNAVHLDMMTIQVEDINLNVVAGSDVGESIIQDVKGVSITIQRSLRDLLHRMPNIELDIQIHELKASLSNREYEIITECAQSNISELPNLEPPLAENSLSHIGEVTGSVVPQDSDNVKPESQEVQTWITTRVSIVIDLVELSLHYGLTRDSSLAILQVSGLWLLYKSNTLGEGFLSSTLEGFSVIDDREGTEQELRLAIQRPKVKKYNSFQSGTCGTHQHLKENSHLKDSNINLVPTMLILDARLSELSTYVSLRVQRPQMLVSLDFLLAVAEFFVPSLRSTMLNQEQGNSSAILDGLILDQATFSQPNSEFVMSPKKPLIADDERFDIFSYDGRGGTLYLHDRQGLSISSPSPETIIYVGSGKKLIFKNVTIKNGIYLDSCVSLGANSSYSASEDDKVYLEGEAATESPHHAKSTNNVNSKDAAANKSTEFIIEFEAIGPELTFYNSAKNVADSLVLTNKLLHCQLDALGRLVMKGDYVEMSVNSLGFSMECNGIRVLEPFDTHVKFSNTSGRTNVNLVVSDVFMNFSFSILQLFLAVEEDILAFLRRTSKKMTMVCSEFDKIGTIRIPDDDQIYAFWRARAPPGFAVLGDYLTPIDKPPTKGVIAVNTSFVRVKRPDSFRLVWPPSSSKSDLQIVGVDGNESICSIWLPEAPDGYVAMGCVVSPGRMQPPAASAFCILGSLVSQCGLRDCVNVGSKTSSCSLAFWRVDNSVGTFLPADPASLGVIGRAYELQQIFFGALETSLPTLKSTSSHESPTPNNQSFQSEQPSTVTSGRRTEAVATFRLIWWNQGPGLRKKLSVWRPNVPEGMVYFGDIAVQGYEPPNSCIVLHDSEDADLYKAPTDFQLVGNVKKHRGVDPISFWMPQAPPGFVPLGCVASRHMPKPSEFASLRCIRGDMVIGDQFSEDSIWDTSDIRFTKEPFSIWNVDNELGTFIVRSGLKKPPRRFALKLADPVVPNNSDSTVIDAEIRTFSAALFDDYGGLMVPLCNVSLGGIGFGLRGRPDYLNSSISFSLVARSFNDKYESWEPLIEPVDGLLRYQYNLNASGVASQLRLTTMNDLNLNVSVSNANTVLQAYASWNNLSLVRELSQETPSPREKSGSAIDVYHQKTYHIVPVNQLGQDIFIRASERGQFENIIKMPSGDAKSVKVPVSKNMLDSHLRGNLRLKLRTMVTIVIAEAEFPKVEGLSGRQYTLSIRLALDQNCLEGSHLDYQNARTKGSGASGSGSSETELVKWNEVFFFKIGSLDHYKLELTATDIGQGENIGFFSAPLDKISCSERPSYSADNTYQLTSAELSSSDSMITKLGKTMSVKVRFAVLLSPKSKLEDTRLRDRSSFLQISPAREGPWTMVRLNYAAPSACWRLGNDVVASEVSVRDGNRYVHIRSLVSVRNNTSFTLDLRIVAKASSDTCRSGLQDDRMENQGDAIELIVEEFFETEKYNPSIGWISSGTSEDGSFGVELSPGWEWVDEWHVDSSSVNTADGWVYAPDFESLKWPESYNPLKHVNYARQRRWIRNRKPIFVNHVSEIFIGPLKPGEVTPLPLSVLNKLRLYVLHLRPSIPENIDEYLWSSVMDGPSSKSYNVNKLIDARELCVSSLEESEELLYCPKLNGTSSTSSHGLWFCLSIQAAEISKDVRSNPIHDWTIVIKPPISLTNYLPLNAEYSVLEMQASGDFLPCSRGVFKPGDTAKVHNANIKNPLFFSLLPQGGWLPLQEAVLISHPSSIPTKALFVRSSISGRIAQIILEQNQAKERALEAKVISIYSPYWLSIAKCPRLSLRLIDVGSKNTGKFASPFRSKKSNEAIIEEITEEEIYEGYTIASVLNLKSLGLSASVSESSEQHFGPMKDLSPLGEMDGSMDLNAYTDESHYIQLFISSKPCPYQSVPTKVICVRPYITFTNRLGQNLHLKLSREDEVKILHASDVRVSFVCRDTGGTSELQVRLDDTDWSYPLQIVKEDTISLMLRQSNGSWTLLRLEIRGYEEGSRFIVVFRLGSTRGPIRIENRTRSMEIKLCQSGFGDDTSIRLQPLSSANFAWNDFYGTKSIDVEIHKGSEISLFTLAMDKAGLFPIGDRLGLHLHIVDVGEIKFVRFVEELALASRSNETLHHTACIQNQEESEKHSKSRESESPLELIVELGAVGVSIVDHRPKELSYLYLERVFISYSTGYDGGMTSRFKLILGYLQLDNQLPLALMPVILAPHLSTDNQNPVFKMTVTVRNENLDGIQVYPYIYLRVTDRVWRVNIHEPIIWAMVDFFNNLQLDRVDQSSNISQVDPEIRIDLIDISEMRLKVSLETAPAHRPHGALGVWSPVLSAIGNAFKIQVHLRKVMRRDRFMRKSSVVSAIGNRIFRDLIHNPLHLLFSVDIFGVASSTLASLSKGFAELSTDGQFLQLRSKQVWSRRITGVGDGFMQGTEALAQGFAFGVTGVVTKPVESARQNGLLGLAHGLGRAFLGFVVQPVSGALDFVSLTVDGIGASCSKCLEILNNKTTLERIRNPRAIHSDNILRDYCEREAVGQMVLYLAEESRHFGCTEIFKEPSKFAWSDYYEEYFVVPYQRIVLVTSRRIVLLQCVAPDMMDKKPCKIMWDVPWEEILALELAKAGYSQPSHLIIHLKSFRRSENFVRVIKCSIEDDLDGGEPQAVKICHIIRKMWKTHHGDTKNLTLKVPSSQRNVFYAWSEVNVRDPGTRHKAIIKSKQLSSSSSHSDEKKLVRHSINFSKIWSSEQQIKRRCTMCHKQASEDGGTCSIWRPICPDGYVSVGDIARAGSHPPTVAAVYHNFDKLLSRPVGYDLVWRNCQDDYVTPVSIWYPRAPEGYVALGCVAVSSFTEPEPNTVYCVAESLVEDTIFEEQKIWSAPGSYPWACHIYQVQSEALHFVALRQPREESDWKTLRVIDEPQSSNQISDA
ncbi:hypothetical protein Leryth_005471 [Lithospermum erythrorhizon]|nr:hypothetical protein Leryth_005471 [Lithospermum erythrorhizon]